MEGHHPLVAAPAEKCNEQNAPLLGTCIRSCDANLVASHAVTELTAHIVTFAESKKLILDFLGPFHGVI
jgi:hypothetical protein